jgi:hypothetical protein
VERVENRIELLERSHLEISETLVAIKGSIDLMARLEERYLNQSDGLKRAFREIKELELRVEPVIDSLPLSKLAQRIVFGLVGLVAISVLTALVTLVLQK